ncbi:MAG: hypothetical protein Q9209_006413 [Squamulea sp. 1 TL-2023]
MPSRPLLPLINSSFPFASPVLSLQTVSGVISPATPVSGEMHRSGSTRSNRAKELLTPIKASFSSTPISPLATELVKDALDVDEGFIAKDPVFVGSHINFFARHPEDSTNPLTFLDGSSDAGTGDTTSGKYTAGGRLPSELETESMKEEMQTEMQTTAQDGRSSLKSARSYASVFYTPPEIESYLLASGIHDDQEGRSPPIPILIAPRKLTGDGRRQPRFERGEKEMILRARPVTLHELPGRFRSKDPCWYCCDEVIGKRCEVCGLVVRSANPDRWG